jgi:hypothetical protein
MNHEPGSKDSLNWLRCLKDAENNDIFLSNLIILVDFKWENVKYYVYLDGIVHLIYGLFLGIDASFFDNTEKKEYFYSKVVMTVYTVIMLIREFYQIRIKWVDQGFYQSFVNYIKDGYNVFDFCGQIAYLVYCVEKLVTAQENKYFEYLHVSALFMLFIRAISQLRIKESTRYLIRMITEVIAGMVSFLIILLFSTIAFAIVFYKIHNLENEVLEMEGKLEDITELSLKDQFYFSFKLAILGDFDSFAEKLNTPINFIVFALTSIFQLIVMLNLLIAVISDTFDKV